MKIYKLTLTISGDHFLVSDAVKNISGGLELISKTELQDYDTLKDAYGSLVFMHPQKFAIAGQGRQYEEDFVFFIEKNFKILVDSGGVDFDLYTEYYYSDYQCNFEILDRNLISRVICNKINIALPVSIYKMTAFQIKELLKS